MPEPDLLTQHQRYTDANGTPPGDCWRTALACLLAVERDSVPHFIHEYHGQALVPDSGTNWVPLWWAKSVEWVEENLPGWTLGNYGPEFPLYADPEAAPPRLIATGPSPRGDWLHAVIVDARTGALVHDPHPSGDGVLSIESVAALVQVEVVAEPGR